jgi:putative endonuclease
MRYFVYILYGKILERFYIGTTNNIERRLAQHNRPHKGYTNSGQPWVLLYSEQFASKKDALKRELYIKKKKSKEFIEKLVESPDA